MSNPIDFIRDFLNYFDKVGIFDEFDKETQKMRTSAGVMALVKEARTYLPPRLKSEEADKLMRELPEDLRDALIEQSDKKRVIDLRREFARRQAANGGAQGLLRQMLDAFETSDQGKFEAALRDAKGIVDAPETVFDTPEEAGNVKEV